MHFTFLEGMLEGTAAYVSRRQVPNLLFLTCPYTTLKCITGSGKGSDARVSLPRIQSNQTVDFTQTNGANHVET